MINEEYKKIGLYDHNADSYDPVKKAYEDGEDVVGIVHATGTGKTYIALQLAYDNKDKKIVYVVPSLGIIEHIKKIIDSNPYLDFDRDFPNLEFRTYQSLITLSEEAIAQIDCDLLILDEFHHIGAPIWGQRMDVMIKTHPSMKIFGMTAYTVRDRGTSYERDMANPNTNEVFSRKIQSRYDLCDAMIDGVLPKPIYKSAYINLMGLEQKVEEKVEKLDATSEEYQEYMKILMDVKKRIHEAPSIPTIFKRSIKPNGKYIYFCPPLSEEGVNDIETIKKQAIEWFKEFVPVEDIVFYTTTSDMDDHGKTNRDAFYEDRTLDGTPVDGKLRVMFAINQYNEGIHAPNIDGVIMGRGTSSDIVYFEQLGRALSVRGNTKERFEELEKYSIEELIEICKRKDIPVKENTTKEELIEKLIAPTVIDLTNNFNFIKDLENNLKDRIKELQTKGLGNHRKIKISDASFDIEIENQDLYEMLSTLLERLTRTWDEWYGYAELYFKHYRDLNVPTNFKTNDGFTENKENGKINLGNWVRKQRVSCDPNSERGKKLNEIGMIWDVYEYNWNQMYGYAELYFKHNRDLNIPNSFKTNDGFTEDKNGKINLGKWISEQRASCNPISERGKKLNEIGMIWENVLEYNWNQMYGYAELYFKYNRDLNVPNNFKTNDGFTEDKNGEINLGYWISTQRKECDPNSKRGKKLTEIGMIWENIFEYNWNQMYVYAQKYFEHHGSLGLAARFKTNDGFTEDKNGEINLGSWISTQRKDCDPKSPRGLKLTEIGMIWDVYEYNWNQMYAYAQKYFEHHGSLGLAARFKTSDGFTEDKENGKINLGAWISTQRKDCDPESPHGKKLTKIGMIWSIKKSKAEIDDLCAQYSIDTKINKTILEHISIQELQAKIKFLESNNVPLVGSQGQLHEIFSMRSQNMKEKYGLSLEEMITEYYINQQRSQGE